MSKRMRLRQIALLAGVLSFSVMRPAVSQEISFREHAVTNSLTRGRDVYVCDVNHDGHVDIVAGADSEVSWWENDENQDFTRHLISSEIDVARSVRAGDIDGDGDVDVAAAIWGANEIRWWRNDGQEGYDQIILDTTVVGPHTVDLKDVDGDDHMDILFSGFDMSDSFSEIGWWENDPQVGLIKHVISERFQQSPFIYGAFINDDEYMDILACGELNGEVVWWENDGFENFTEYEHMVDSSYAYAHTVLAKDLDLDGDTDILGAACLSSQLTWWENDGEEAFEKHHVENLIGALWIDAVDLDKDGDRDLIGAGMGAANIAWWENDGFENFTQRSVEGDLAEAYCIVYADMDNDLDHDLVAIGNSSNTINWYENDLCDFDFEAEPTSGHAPVSAQFTDLSTADPPILSWAWDFNNDGIVDSENPDAMWTYENPGIYTVCLDVVTDSLSKTIVRQDYIHVFDGESALLFDGDRSYATCAAAPSLNLTDRLCVEAWINPAGWGEMTNSGQGRVVDKANFALYLNGTASPYNDHSLVFLLKNSSGPPVISGSPANSVVLGEWQHVAVTYDASSSLVTMYINGIEQPLTQSNTPSGPIRDNSDIDMIIGNSSGGIYTFDGLIDEVRVWDTVRDGDELAATMNHYLHGTEEALVAYWPMNEGNGTILGDGSGSDNDAALVDAAWRQGIALDPASSDKEAGNNNPTRFSLVNCLPNPFNRNVEIRFRIAKASHMKIGVFDISGQLVKTLVNGRVDPGDHTLIWNGTDDRNRPIASGVYLCRMEESEFSATRQILFVR